MCPLEELPAPPEFTSCCHTVPMSAVHRVKRKCACGCACSTQHKCACACNTTASSSVRYDCFYVSSLNSVFKVLF